MSVGDRDGSVQLVDTDSETESLLVDNDHLTAASADIEPLLAEIARIDAEVSRLRLQKRQLQTRVRHMRAQAQSKDTAAQDSEALQRAIKHYTEHDDFAWTAGLQEAMSGRFGISELRGVQKGVINAVMDGRDCVVVAPTGSGKSLCYHLPAVMQPGRLVLVVSPLIALMDDQVLRLQQLGVGAEAHTSESRNAAEIKSRLRALAEQGEESAKRRRTDLAPLQLLFVAPERLVASRPLVAVLQRVLEAGRLALVAVDECHCASEYGSDFRPDYGRLGLIRSELPGVPIVALTATCPPSTLSGVLRALALDTRRTLVFRQPLWRANLRFSVLARDPSITAAQQAAQWVPVGQRGIVYCATRSDVHDVAAALDARGISCSVYHGSLDRVMRKRVHSGWRAGQTAVVVATNAFGMGVDQPDVDYVLHVTAPRTLEAYYQEAGRAGRDGRSAQCVLLYQSLDASRLVGWGFDAQAAEGVRRARAMVAFAEERRRCRKTVLLEHLGSNEDAGVCGVCDVCDGSADLPVPDEVVRRAERALARASVDGGRMTMARLLRCAGALATEVPARDLGFVASDMVARGILLEDFAQTAYSTNAYLCPGPGAERLLQASNVIGAL